MAKVSFFDRAREEVNLVDLVSSFLGGDKPFRMGKSLRWSCCPLCGKPKDSNNPRFSVKDGMAQCFACDFKGGVVDLAAAYWRMDPLEAAKKLLMEDRPAVIVNSVAMAQSEVSHSEQREALHEVLKRMRGMTREPVKESVAYLMGRGISERTIKMAIDRGILGFLPGSAKEVTRLLVHEFGQEKLIKAGLWGVNDDTTPKKMPGIAFRPIVFYLPDSCSAEFRINRDAGPDERKSIRYGSSDYPWFWKGEEYGMMVVEGAIDLLSAVDLGYTGSVIGLAGVKNWKAEWFQKATQNGIGRVVNIAFDNDVESSTNTGQVWAAKLKDALATLGIQSLIKTPPPGDLNDLLKSRLGIAA